MVQIYKDILSESDIDYILNLSEVKKAKYDIDRKIEGSVYFSIELSQDIKNTIFEKFGLTLSRIPMRWIKGDTKPHIDRGESTFDNTYLVYITDNQGEFLIENNSYSIKKNTGFKFSESLSHETINTGSIPRLLLGPMSEQGFAVGAAGIYVPGGTTIYIRQTTDIEYSVDDQVTWYSISSLFPVVIANTDNSGGVVIVEFITDIILDDNSIGGQNKYFYCSTSDIQFGSTSLNNDGSRPSITIDGVSNYLGFIQNGNSFVAGFNNIYIFNLEIKAINGTTLSSNGGWIGQEYFAKNAIDCYIVNCYSDGDIIDAGGGIVGGYAASEGGNLQIISCSSSGNSATYSGGIIGYYAGKNNGNVTCEKCWSTGNIGLNGGGIFGYSAGDTSGIVNAINCYSTGPINNNGGGIFGQVAGSSGQANAQNCYSQGNISTNAGGIYGSGASSDGGTTSAINCYSTGIITTIGNGIYGSNPQSGYSTTNCYFANGTWNTTTANSNLTGIPNSPSVIGTTWVATTINQPYELLNMGYTPYTITNISVSGGVPSIVRTSTQTIGPNSSTNAAIISGNSYTILEKSGGNSGSYSTITIDSTSGVISTTSSTIPETYTLYIRNTGSYNITIFDLIIQENPVPIQVDNSFRVSDLLLDELQNYIYLSQAGVHGGYNISFTIYDIMLLELLNDSLLN